MKKRFVAAMTVVLAAALALVGCGGAGGGNSITGRYEGYATTVFGTSDAIENTYGEGDNYVELKDGDAAVVCLDGDPIDATYKVDGEIITITINEGEESYDSEGTVKDGVLTFDFLGLGLELTFVKDGVDKPFELTATADETTTVDETTDDTEATEEVTDETSTEGAEETATESDESVEGTESAEATETNE